MKDFLGKYIINLYNNIPDGVIEGLLSVFCVGVVSILVFYGIKRGWRKVAGLLLAEYVYLIYCSTVFLRSYNENQGHDFHLFWSYVVIRERGRVDFIAENIMNVVVFVPVGLLFGCAARSMTWWKVLLIGCGISVSIEVMQFFLRRGFAETDDVMHNTLGCMIGFGLYSLVRYGYERIHKRSVGVL